MANLLDQVSNALSTAQGFVEGGKLNVTVQDPVVQVSAEQALKVAEPYIIALIAVVFVLGLMLLRK